MTDKARSESSNAIDRNRSSLKQKPVQLFSFPVGRPQRHPRRLETKTNLSLRIPFRTSCAFSFSFLFLIFFLFFPFSSRLFFLFFRFILFIWFFCFRRRKCTRDVARIRSNAFTRARKIRTTRKRTTDGLACYIPTIEANIISVEIYRRVYISHSRLENFWNFLENDSLFHFETIRNIRSMIFYLTLKLNSITQICF